ncbi:DUF6492 family protein [Aurantimonas endophytica]|uniref:Uncharacterized protein n=1 Tax=Aurantimonas endophytica TaxID=1522175 RepID=A0A7W6HD08_9HYPH|nr:DUF6492 family protein [Aurantimonas endophytica]MBB4002791.1 hypothetical protein [Aurantimonas endophytica]MCO6403669.1 hypothetical protein [Aurantimonas endophytica]
MQTAIVTSSYRGDLERCRLLCESIDRRVTGHTRHLILVESRDVALFRGLAGPRREIVDERDLLPFWLRPFPDPLSLGRRRFWLSPMGPPLRGWHVQQLRRIAMAAALDETVMVSVDSDVVFLRPFDVGWFHEGEKVRFYRRPGALAALEPGAREEHRKWSRKAGQLLGIDRPEETDTGYIATLIAWRSDTVREMLGRIESRTGRSWASALAATRTLSECTLYGRFVDEIEARPDRHSPGDVNLCHMYWTGQALGAEALHDFAADLEPHQVAAGIQSFTGTDPALIRRAAGLA